MPAVVITLTDMHKDGKPCVKFTMKLDREGVPDHAPITDAMILGATMRRLWESQTLGTMVPLIAGDLLQARQQMVAKAMGPGVLPTGLPPGASSPINKNQAQDLPSEDTPPSPAGVPPPAPPVDAGAAA